MPVNQHLFGTALRAQIALGVDKPLILNMGLLDTHARCFARLANFMPAILFAQGQLLMTSSL